MGKHGDRYKGSGLFGATLLWQRRNLWDRENALDERGEFEDSLRRFLEPEFYAATGPEDFGTAIATAVERLIQARDKGEKVAIWGDFDADGVTATAVLWEGLGQFFPGDRLSYTIPNRLTESHGLNESGLRSLATQGVNLIVTCDTGSTNLVELALARELGLDVIVTDHHSLPPESVPAVAVINPRSLPV
ncbi:MAG: DHH family phosphoesterase, partial [Cyanobacteria bacterium P01_H01_bin.130]